MSVLTEPVDAVTRKVYEQWHKGISAAFRGETDVLQTVLREILSEDVTFKAPTYWKTRQDKNFAIFALIGVSQVFKEFVYTREFLAKGAFALEFTCRVGENGPMMRGIDLVTCNADGKITSIEVMARPPKSVELLQEYQAKFLIEMGIIKPRPARL